MKVRGRCAAMVLAAAAAASGAVLVAPAASAATTSTVVGTACYVGSTETATVRGDLDNSHPPAQTFRPSWANGVISYRVTFTGITNPGWAWIWADCKIGPDRGGWVRTTPGGTSTLNL